MNRDYPLEKGGLDDPLDEITEPRAPPTGARIVVVDDDGDMRDLVTTRLASEGYDVCDAVSGGDLLRVIQSIAIDRWPLDSVDLIVVDNRMPGMSGLEAIRRLRTAHWETPAILMTAFPEAEVKREAANLGVPLIPKPFSLDLLASAILLSLLSAPVRQERHAFRVPS
jgi:CheY-like chemotaxis protein